jgi:hypothetical protein
MAVVGTARLAGTTVCSPDTSWRHHHRDFGLSRDEYDAYLDGLPTPTYSTSLP